MDRNWQRERLYLSLAAELCVRLLRQEWNPAVTIAEKADREADI